MFLDYLPAEGDFVVRRDTLMLVPEFQGLFQQHGENAIKYLFAFACPLSPYAHQTDELARDGQVRAAILQRPWDKARAKLPDNFHKDPLMQAAIRKYRELDDWTEASIEVTLRNKVRALQQEIEDCGLTDEELERLEKLTKIVDSINKQLQAAKKALSERIQTDDGPAALWSDV